MSSTLGKNIKTFRKNKGFTQEELAELLSVTPQAVSKWESGSGLPDVSMLIPLAQILGVSTDALLGYDTMSEDKETAARVKETINGIGEAGERAENALKICELLSAETNLNPGNFEIIKMYVKETANLSMYADPKLEGYFQDQKEHLQKIYADSIKKGAYLISHCTDKKLVEATHYALAWIYIHNNDFEKARDHVNVLSSIATGTIKENIDMEIEFFESGFNKMKGTVPANSILLFNAVASFLNNIAEKYGWWSDDLEETIAVCDWCEGIIKAFGTRKKCINMTHYLRVRRSIAFFRMVAAKKAGKDKEAEELYMAFIREVENEDLTSEEKKTMIQLLNNDVAYYSKYQA